MLGTKILKWEKIALLCTIHICRYDIRGAAGQHQGVSPHEGDRESAEELACGLPVITSFFPGERCTKLLHLTNCCAVEAAQGFKSNWQESQALCPTGLSSVPHFEFKSLC